MSDFFLHQMSLPEIGTAGQAKLFQSSVLVIGIGGLGCAALPYLAASGIAKIGLVDFDCVEESNLARQTLFGNPDIGHWKAEKAAKHLACSYPHADIRMKICKIADHNAREIVADYDLVIDGTDNLQARLAIDAACSDLQKPWVYGSIHQWEGQVSLFVPGFSYRMLFPEGTEEEACKTCSSGGILGPFAGMIGAIQAIEAIKWLAGVEKNLAGKILRIHGRSWRLTVADIIPFPSTIEISFGQIKIWQKDQIVQMIDIRELHENQNVNLNGNEDFSTSLDRSKKVVVYCQRGHRSFEFACRLRKQGYEAYSLQGGLDASKAFNTGNM